jgi:hypothetical protein
MTMGSFSLVLTDVKDDSSSGGNGNVLVSGTADYTLPNTDTTMSDTITMHVTF